MKGSLHLKKTSKNWQIYLFLFDFFFFNFFKNKLSGTRIGAPFWCRPLLALANDFIKQVPFVFHTEKVLIKAVGCSQPGSVVTWHCGSCYLIGWLPGVQGGKGMMRAFQMVVIDEALQTARLMNTTQHVFGMEGPCWAITLSVKRGILDVVS